MLRRFDDCATALSFGREMGERYGCRVSFLPVFLTGELRSVYFIALPSSGHLLPFRSGDYSPWGGWYFGGPCSVMDTTEEGKRLLAEPDREALPGRGEHLYQLVVSSCSGLSPERMAAVALAVEHNGTCVWHEAAALAGTECFCVKCKTGKIVRC